MNPIIPQSTFLSFIRKHQLAVEALTEDQLAEAFRQALAAGDFQRNLRVDHGSQSVNYIPFRELESLRSRLESAKVFAYDGEARTVTLQFELMPCAAIGENWLVKPTESNNPSELLQ